MDITKYLIDEALILIPVLLILGKFMKMTPKMLDWLIPYILLIVGIVLTIAMLGFNVDSIVQGVLVAGASVFGYELFKNAKERD